MAPTPSIKAVVMFAAYAVCVATAWVWNAPISNPEENNGPAWVFAVGCVFLLLGTMAIPADTPRNQPAPDNVDTTLTPFDETG